jgi:hypothetical protein
LRKALVNRNMNSWFTSSGSSIPFAASFQSYRGIPSFNLGKVDASSGYSRSRAESLNDLIFSASAGVVGL